jgi:hypothetical protein
MGNNNDNHVLHLIYDRLYDVLTYAPSGRPSAVDPKSLIQLAQNFSVNPGEFEDAVTPTNLDGDLAQTEAFSRLMDRLSEPSTLYIPSAATLSDTYSLIVNGADTLIKPTAAQQKIYDDANEILWDEMTLVDKKGVSHTTPVESDYYQAYKDAQGEYTGAITAYRTAYFNLDLTQKDQQREWQTEEPALKAGIDDAYRNLTAGGSKLVEGALAALSSSINNGVSLAIAQAQTTMKNSAQPSNLPNTSDWYLSYASPGNWTSMEAIENMSDISIDTTSENYSKNSNFNAYSAGIDASWGLWSVGADVSGSSTHETEHSDSTNLKLTAKIGTVQIVRPWYTPYLFGLKSWFINGYARGKISDGKSGISADTSQVLPFVPAAFVVARDIVLSGNFSQADRDFIAKQFAANVSVGWGPFKVKTGYSQGDEKETVSHDGDITTIRTPGLQIIGFINALTPFSPSDDPPQQ